MGKCHATKKGLQQSSTNVVTESSVCAGDTDDCRDRDEKGLQETSAVVSVICRVCREKMSVVES
jgi:hypothetical protein